MVTSKSKSRLFFEKRAVQHIEKLNFTLKYADFDNFYEYLTF